MHPAPPFRVTEAEALIGHLTAYPFMGFSPQVRPA